MYRVSEPSDTAAGSAGPAIATSDADDAALRLRLEALAKTIRITSVANIPLACMVAAAFWSTVSPVLLSVWIGVLLVLACLRWTLIHLYRQGWSVKWETTSWAALAVAQSVSMGATWGLAVLWLARHADAYQSTLLVCVSILLGLGALANVSYWPACVTVQVPLLLLGALGFATAGRPEAIYLASGLVLASGALALIGRQMGTHATMALLATMHTQTLLNKLREANDLLQRLAVTDALTGLANRRAFDTVLASEWARAIRSGRPISLLMLDVDQFKAFNDRYGHLAGDQCLRRVGAVLEACVRGNVDFAVRYGGEEFVVLLPETDEGHALQVGERYRRAIADLQEPHPGSEHGVLTVSIGVASLVPTEDASSDELVAAADEALYHAKKAGRNRVHGRSRAFSMVA